MTIEKGSSGHTFFSCGLDLSQSHTSRSGCHEQSIIKHVSGSPVPLFEFGTHPLDLLCFFFGNLPVSITAHTPRPAPGLEADVIVQATLRFPGERMATLMLNRVSRAPERYLEMRIDCEKASLRISFGGLARASLSWSRSLGRPAGRFSLVRGGEARLESGGVCVRVCGALAGQTAMSGPPRCQKGLVCRRDP